MEISGKRTFHDLNINNISGIDNKVNELFRHTPINFSGEMGGISTRGLGSMKYIMTISARTCMSLSRYADIQDYSQNVSQ